MEPITKPEAQEGVAQGLQAPLSALETTGLKPVLDYSFKSLNLSNPDGSLPTAATNCSPLAGPGPTAMGTYDHALNFGTDGRARVSLPKPAINFKQFCVRIAFQANSPVNSRQNLVESDLLPFAIFLDKTNGTSEFKACVSVATQAHGWSGATTEFFTTLQTGNWYVCDLVYDMDTIAIFINGIIQSVHAFPNGRIATFSGTNLYIGTWVDGARNHFPGNIAGLQLFAGIPEQLEEALDERRSHPEWFLTYKYEQIKNTLNFGNPTSRYAWDANARAYIQNYPSGLIMYNDQLGAAFELHGAILAYYRARSAAERFELGYLISDEGNTTKAGGRKNLFSKGGIYWSPATGAHRVTGQIYINYEQMNESAFFGWPTTEPVNITGGREQVFQVGRMYHRNGAAAAHEVHGAILSKFLASGGISTWGYPVTNEMDVRRNNQVIGKSSEFEHCTIYWSGQTGAFEVHGDIRRKYEELNGPLSELGFPTSDEQNIPGAAGAARCNTFQNGSILWFGSYSSIQVCYPFKIFIGRINSKESEGAFMGQNDLYLRVILQDNGHEIFRQRYPNSGDYGGRNIIDLNQTLSLTVVPNSLSRNIKLTIDVWESDSGAPFGGGDDHLGIYTKTLNAANAWGLRENNGTFNSGSFQKINSITWSVKPQINPNLLTPQQKFWGVKNKGTASLSYQQYASAFRDVDSESEWWDVTDWLEKAFYELVCKGIASGGNCFGMSLEAINAWKHRSTFSLPLNRFTDWNAVVNEFNIKHQYQVGAEAIWWFVGQFLTGNTHDPRDVFNETRNCFSRGLNPVVCIAQNWDFSGKPHCVMPFAWDSSSKPWKMSILDPNFPNAIKTLFVDPDRNTFTYDAGNKYEGGEWTGGRFHFMPYNILCERPRTPIWDAIALLLSGTILILGSDAETVSLKDINGTDLDIFSNDAVNRQKQGKTVDNHFFPFKGFDGGGVLASEMFMRIEKPTAFVATGAGLSTGFNRNTVLSDMMADRNLSGLIRPLASDPALLAQLRDRDFKSIASDTKLRSRMSAQMNDAINKLQSGLPAEQDYIHTVRNKKAGELKYAVKSRLNQFLLQAKAASGENHTIHVQDLGEPSSVVNVKAAKDKLFNLEVTNKLGVGKDELQISISNIPAAAAKELQLNLKPGLGGLDIIASAQKASAVVSVSGKIDGKAFKNTFDVDLDGGVRLRPSTILSDGELSVGKIDQLFGPARGIRQIKSK